MVELEYGSVERDVNGVLYQGIFLLENGIVTVCSPLLGERSSQKGDSPANTIAGILLWELIKEANARGDLPGPSRVR